MRDVMKQFFKNYRQIKAIHIEDLKLILIILGFLIVQIVYVYSTFPSMMVLSDESLYVRIARQIAEKGVVENFQYPFLYPLIVCISLKAGRGLYSVTLAVNILIKVISLVVIFCLLKRFLKENLCYIAVIFVAFSPIFFIWSRVVMAENLLAPLLLIAVLFHYNQRKSGNKRELIIAAFLAFLLWMTKYLAIVLLPFFCIYWGLGKWGGHKDSRIKAILECLSTMICYTAVVIGCLAGYALYVSIRLKCGLSFDLIRNIMGLSMDAAIKAENYFFLQIQPQWLFSYISWTCLSVFLLIILCIVNGHSLTVVSKEWLMILSIICVCLLFVATRHSSTVSYNDNGQMVKLVGRYVDYIVLIAIIFSVAFYNSEKNSEKVFCVRKNFLIIIVSSAFFLIIPYLVIYTDIFLNHEYDWVGDVRCIDNIAFFYGQWRVVILLMVFAFLLLIFRKRLVYQSIIISLSFLIQPFSLWRNIDAINGYNNRMVQQYRSFIKTLDMIDSEYVILPSAYLTYAYLDMISNVYAYDKYDSLQCGGYRVYSCPMYVDGKTTYVAVESNKTDVSLLRHLDIDYYGTDPYIYFEFDDKNFKTENNDLITIERQEGKFLFTGLQDDNCLVVNNDIVIPIYEASNEGYYILDGNINFEYSLMIYDFTTMKRYEFDAKQYIW